MADTKGLLKMALIGGAGYWAYIRFFGGSSAAMSEIVPVGGSTGGATIPTPAPPTPAPPAPAVTPTNPDAVNAALLAGWQAAGKNIDLLLGGAASLKSKANESGQYRLNWHQWNYYRTAYTAANNLALPNYAPQDVGEGDGSKLYTANEFQAVLTAKGEPYASGLGGIVPVGSAYFVQGHPLSTLPVFPMRIARGR